MEKICDLCIIVHISQVARVPNSFKKFASALQSWKFSSQYSNLCSYNFSRHKNDDKIWNI